MKTNIHPKYYPQAKVTCSCGNTFETGSTVDNLQVDICSACHPFFTGEMRFVDTQGRVEKFETMRQKAEKLQSKLKSKKSKKKDTPEETAQPKTLKEMMQQIITDKDKPTAKFSQAK